jgi:hypothetical protein
VFAIVQHVPYYAIPTVLPQWGVNWGVRIENLIRMDCVTESPNVNGDDRSVMFLPDPVRLAVQVEEPT